MSTRQEIQIAQDLVRFVNIMNDLMNCASWILKEIEPQTGTPYKVLKPSKELLLEHYTQDEIDAMTDDEKRVAVDYLKKTLPKVDLERDATLEELKALGKRVGQNVLGYRNMIQSFITKYGRVDIVKALASWKINYQDLLDDITKMETEARNLNNNVEKVQTKADLISFANGISANIPKLVLVRRSWHLGL